MTSNGQAYRAGSVEYRHESAKGSQVAYGSADGAAEALRLYGGGIKKVDPTTGRTLDFDARDRSLGLG